MGLKEQLFALVQIIGIDVVLAGDNAIMVGLAASRVALEVRAKVILWGIVGAVVLRIFFALVTTQLMAIIGLTLAGGILLLWVCWKMYREIKSVSATSPSPAGLSTAVVCNPQAPMGFSSALAAIIVADVSMSLDNVLAVAGAAKGNLPILAAGLALSIGLMALAASLIARLLKSYPWISWMGLVVIFYVALEMIWRGTQEVGCLAVAARACQSGLGAVIQALLMIQAKVGASPNIMPCLSA
jgi:YjbE family integral membrane protein